MTPQTLCAARQQLSFQSGRWCRTSQIFGATDMAITNTVRMVRYIHMQLCSSILCPQIVSIQKCQIISFATASKYIVNSCIPCFRYATIFLADHMDILVPFLIIPKNGNGIIWGTIIHTDDADILVGLSQNRIHRLGYVFFRLIDGDNHEDNRQRIKTIQTLHISSQIFPKRPKLIPCVLMMGCAITHITIFVILQNIRYLHLRQRINRSIRTEEA